MRDTSLGQRRAFIDGEVAPTEEVRPGVFAVAMPMPGSGIPFSLSYLVDGGDGSLHLIDTAVESDGNWDRLRGELRRFGRSIDDIATITLTHLHADHAGLAARIRAASGAELSMHRLDARPMREAPGASDEADATQSIASDGDGDGEAMPQLERWGVPEARRAELRAALSQRLAAGPDTAVDRELRGGETLVRGERRWSVLHTPGHTAGHICLVDAAAGLVFTGDHVLPLINPGVGLGLRAADDDPLGDYLASLAAIARLDAYEACPGHGHRFRGLRERCAELGARHRARGGQMRALVAEAPASTVWEVASRSGWTGGFDALTGTALLSALRQTDMHLRRSE